MFYYANVVKKEVRINRNTGTDAFWLEHFVKLESSRVTVKSLVDFF